MSADPAPPPKVFISYTHDTDEQKRKVVDLAQRLRRGNIDCQIDQFDPIKPEGLQRWMLNKIDWADFVLIVCTEKYHAKFRGQEGGGGEFEGALILDELYKNKGENRKFIAIGFAPFSGNPHIPNILKRWSYFDVSTETGYDELYYRIWDDPEVIPDALGERRTRRGSPNP